MPLLSASYEFFCLTGVRGESLLAQDGLAGVDGHLGMLEVMGVRGCHIYQVNLRVLHHLFIASVSVGDSPLFCKEFCLFKVAGRDCMKDNLRILESCDSFSHLVGYPAGSDDS